MPKYTVASPIKFKGKRREIDSSVEMSEDDAKPHVESGVLLPARISKKEELEAKAKADAEAKAKADAEAKAKADAEAKAAEDEKKK
jgi:membrane protein involved in colicin uptake